MTPTPIEGEYVPNGEMKMTDEELIEYYCKPENPIGEKNPRFARLIALARIGASVIPRPAAPAPPERELAEAREAALEEAAQCAESTPTTLCQNGEFFSERVAKRIRDLRRAARAVETVKPHV